MVDFQDAQPPFRSISLPSRLQPESIKVVSDIKKLRSCPESLTTEAIRANTMSIAELIVRVQDILSSPLTQQALGKDGSRKHVDQAVDRSIMVIDACGQARDMLLAMREQILEVQSSLRRSRGGMNFSCLEAQVRRFMCFRKKAKREAAKHAREMKKIVDNNCTSSSSIERECSHLVIVIQMLNDVNNLVESVLKAIFEFLSTKTTGKCSGGGWSFVSKLMLGSTERKRSLCRQRIGGLTEVETVHSDLCSILGSRNDTEVDLKTTQKRLEGLDCCIKGLEDGLEIMFNRLIQYRVSLLNVLTC